MKLEADKLVLIESRTYTYTESQTGELAAGTESSGDLNL